MDRIIVQVQFKKLWWVCQKCGQEDVEDANVAGGNTYEHNCSACGQWSNSFRQYSGIVNYLEDDYKAATEQDISDFKETLVNRWVAEVKNPPKYVAPTVWDFNNLISDRLAEIEQYSKDLSKIATAAEMTAISDKLTAQKASVDAKIVEIEATPIEEKP